MQKTVLITGCSSGIGWATCQYLKERGYRVFATARKSKDVVLLQQQGLESFKLDVRCSVQIKEVVNEVKRLTNSTLYALCNNAGYAQPGALEDLSKKLLLEQFETNVFGLHELTNAVLPIFHQQGYGRIIHISSVLGLVAMPFRGAYVASKYAVEGLANTLRLELNNTGIFVSLVEPGPIITQFKHNALQAYQQNINSTVSYYEHQYKQLLAHFSQGNTKLSFRQPPQAVAKKIYACLESQRPKPHYYVTLPTHLLAMLKRLLPTKMLDALLISVFKQETK